MVEIGATVIQDRLAKYFLYENESPLAYLELVTHVYEFFKYCADAEYPDIKHKRDCYLKYAREHKFSCVSDMKNLRDAYVHKSHQLYSLYEFSKDLKACTVANMCGYFCSDTNLDRIVELRERANVYLRTLRNTYFEYVTSPNKESIKRAKCE